MCLNIINDPFIAGYFDLVTELLHPGQQLRNKEIVSLITL